MTKIFLNKKRYYLPESWAEVLPAQLPPLLSLLFIHPENGSTYLEILRNVLGYTERQWRKLMHNYFGPHRKEEQRDNNSLVLQAVLGQLEWMWKGELTADPFPKGFEVAGRQWFLFEEGFRSMTFGEMTNAHIHAQAFIQQLVEGEERLDMLVATICRPRHVRDYKHAESWNGDHREPYNEHIARSRAELLKGKLVKEKILALMYFLGTQKEFFSYFDLFESDGAGPPEKEEYPGQSMIKNQHLLSEKHIFGGMDNTKNANVHEVFQYLEEHSKDVKARIAKNQAASNDTH